MYRQGDIYFFNLNPTKGSEEQKTRPCLIISNNHYNHFFNTVMVIPIYSAAKYQTEERYRQSPLFVPIKRGAIAGTALLQHLRTIDPRYRRQSSLKGRLSPAEINHICKQNKTIFLVYLTSKLTMKAGASMHQLFFFAKICSERRCAMTKKRIVLGIVAHVDAGKTTLGEALLYQTGAVRRLGKVEQGSTVLDTSQLERQRKITIFSHQAKFATDQVQVTLLDTPGHLDFGQQTEAVIRVLDAAILVVSATAGLQATAFAYWQLLQRYRVPTFVFINQTDRPTGQPEKVLSQLQKNLSPGIIPFANLDQAVLEQIANQDENALTEYLTKQTLSKATIQKLAQNRKIFPCFAGSALKLIGIDDLLAGLAQWTQPVKPTASFSARVFKISHDRQGHRLTWLKITGGILQARHTINDEKAAELRDYAGEKFTTIQSARPGQTCAVIGLSKTYPGQGLGQAKDLPRPVLQPALTYAVKVEPSKISACLKALTTLADEDPLLQVEFDQDLQEIRVALMGQVQKQVLQSRLAEEFGLQVSFDQGQIRYQETITQPVEGVGHFEPLRHYAEVHLLLEPGPAGSGLAFASHLSTDVLPKNWQDQIMTALQAKTHRGVLIGAPLTDAKITLINGQASTVHSVGGDFRQAAWRAVRQGLMELRQTGACQLLEPVCSYRLLVPADQVGRAISDLQEMSASFKIQGTGRQFQTITGQAPVAAMRDYAAVLRSYSHGQGQLNCLPGSYQPCQDQDSIIKAAAYDPVADLKNSPDSIFCAHGAGYNVRWNQVPAKAHLPLQTKLPYSKH